MGDRAERPLTAATAIHLVMADRWRRSFVLPTFTPRGWWECDVFELTAAGYMREYEVKMTRGDFFADGRKEHARYAVVDGKLQRRPTEKKHDRLAAGDPKGPTRFWYVTPAGLVTPDELPAWAGLIELAEHRWHRASQTYWTPTERKAAPQLHRRRCPKAALIHARGICYWRMHHLLAARHRAGLEPLADDAPAAGGVGDEAGAAHA